LAKIALESQLIQQAEDLLPSAGASPLTSRPSEPTVWEQVIAELESVDDRYLNDEEVEDEEDDEEGARRQPSGRSISVGQVESHGLAPLSRDIYFSLRRIHRDLY